MEQMNENEPQPKSTKQTNLDHKYEVLKAEK